MATTFTTESFFSKKIDYKRAKACWIVCPISTLNTAISSNVPSNAKITGLKLNIKADFNSVAANVYIQHGFGSETSINKHLLNANGEDTKMTSTSPLWYPSDGVNIFGYLNSDNRTISTSNGSYISVRFYSTNIALSSYEVTAMTLSITYDAYYTVIFKNYDGTVLKTESVKEGSSATAPSNPTRAYDSTYHYTFKSWDKAYNNVTSDIEVKVTFNSVAHSYTTETARTASTCIKKGSVTKKCSCGATQTTELALDSNNHTGGTELRNVSSATCTQTGYTGDTHCKSCGAKISSGSTIAALGHNYKSTVVDASVNAPGYTLHTCDRCNDSYKDNYKYYVRWFNEDGSVLLETDNSVPHGVVPKYDGTPPQKASTAEFTYTFKGWHIEVVGATGNIDYYARYTETRNKYTVLWKNWDGTILETDSTEYGQTPTYDGTTPTKPSTEKYYYKFFDWDTEIEEVIKDIVYTAIFTEHVRSYAISWVDYDDTPLVTNEVEYDKTPIYPNDIPTREPTVQYSYVFNKWSPDVVKVSGPATYKATYEEILNQYLVEGTTDKGGTVTGTGIYDYGSSVVLEASNLPGFRFLKWHDGSTENPRTVQVLGEASYLAIFISQNIYRSNILVNVHRGTNSYIEVYRGDNKIYEYIT